MDKFLKDVSSLYWWISVVVVGIIVGIVSNYLPLILSKLGIKLRGVWLERIDKSKRAREEEIRRIVDNPDELPFKYTIYLRKLLGVVLFFVLFGFFWIAQKITGDILYYALAAVMLVIAFNGLNKARDDFEIILYARKGIKDKNEKTNP
jgi:hypothetical protein